MFNCANRSMREWESGEMGRGEQTNRQTNTQTNELFCIDFYVGCVYVKSHEIAVVVVRWPFTTVPQTNWSTNQEVATI